MPDDKLNSGFVRLLSEGSTGGLSSIPGYEIPAQQSSTHEPVNVEIARLRKTIDRLRKQVQILELERDQVKMALLNEDDPLRGKADAELHRLRSFMGPNGTTVDPMSLSIFSDERCEGAIDALVWLIAEE
jgi:hypothetical protein